MSETTSFDEVFNFLSQYQWIHDLHLTQFFISRVWESIPDDWSKALADFSTAELNLLPFYGNGTSHPHASSRQSKECTTGCGDDETHNLSHNCLLSSPHVPDTLAELILRAATLSVPRVQMTDSLPKPTSVPGELRKGMSPKKQHEVEWMASLVHQVAVQSGCSVVVDVGSGLGYLGQALHKEYGLLVIGLESNSSHTEKAERRAAKQDLQCSGVTSIPFFISDDDDAVGKFSQTIRDVVYAMKPCQHTSANQNSSKSFGVCLVGLHCCGDLTPAMLRVFHKTDFVSALCCVSCCYHKMKFDGKHFPNFPMSGAARESYRKVCSQADCVAQESCVLSSSSCVTSTVTSLSSSCVTASLTLPTAAISTVISTPTLTSTAVISTVTSTAAISTMISTAAISTMTSTAVKTATSVSATKCAAYLSSEATSTSFLSPCSLRLAAQETRTRWACQSAVDHQDHTRHVAFRALLQVLFEEKGAVCEDRKTVRRLCYNSAEDFVRSFTASQAAEKQQEVRRELNQLFQHFTPHFTHIQPFTCLQVIVQPVLESVIIQDRQQWLTEMGVTSYIVPVFDQNISPRNLALVAFKS